MAKAREIKWQTNPLDVLLRVDSDEVVYLCSILPSESDRKPVVPKRFSDSVLPLIGVRLVGEGNATNKTSKTLIGSYLSERLKYKTHSESKGDDGTESLDIVTHDESSGITVTAHLRVFAGIPVLRSSSTITNTSSRDIIVSQITSLTAGGLCNSEEWWQDYTLSTANNSWFREAQWRDHTLPNIGIDTMGIYELPDGHAASMANYALSNRGSFSTGTYLPMGLLKRKDGKDTWLWQVENNSSWKWEIGDFKDNVYLAVAGPTSADHGWKQTLAPNESFTTVYAAIAHVLGTPDEAFGAITQYRRRIRRRHGDNERLPVIFNDYMNCLMGDPTEDKITALIQPVVKSGAEYFVIDAGWYADDAGWWDDVGLWEPSKLRFPSGFKNLLDKIRSQGLIPGVWVEPEVIGVRSVVADQLPADAFFQEHGSRIMEKGRYQLDYRHSAVRDRMDKVIDILILEYGVGYFKFDYNIEVIQGTDSNATNSGVGQLDHCRAYLGWVGKLYDRHPDLVIESCSSGAQRMDYAMLAVHSMQSTSDQQDPVLYAAIAAAAPTAVAPEQSATWAYPQSEWDLEKNALTVANSLLGRVHLSGRLDHLSAEHTALVTQGMSVYKSIRDDLRTALPFWPLGLPQWHDEWLCLGMSTEKGSLYLTVWRRGGSDTAIMPIEQLKGRQKAHVELMYPRRFQAEARWEPEKASLVVRLPSVVCARVFHIRPE